MWLGVSMAMVCYRGRNAFQDAPPEIAILVLVIVVCLHTYGTYEAE